MINHIIISIVLLGKMQCIIHNIVLNWFSLWDWLVENCLFYRYFKNLVHQSIKFNLSYSSKDK